MISRARARAYVCKRGVRPPRVLSVQPPATLFLHAALDLYLLAQRNKNRSLYVASHCNQPAAKSSVEIYG